jgi:hypothetical protein
MFFCEILVSSMPLLAIDLHSYVYLWIHIAVLGQVVSYSFSDAYVAYV